MRYWLWGNCFKHGDDANFEDMHDKLSQSQCLSSNMIVTVLVTFMAVVTVIIIIIIIRGQVLTGFWWENLRERNHMQYLCVDGKTILKWIFKNWDGGIEWIYLAQDRDNETFSPVKFGEFLD